MQLFQKKRHFLYFPFIFGIWIFPNLAFTLLPNHAFCMITDPIRVNKTIERTFLLTPKGTLKNKKNAKMFSELVTVWDLVNTQDLKIVERVQDLLMRVSISIHINNLQKALSCNTYISS